MPQSSQNTPQSAASGRLGLVDVIALAQAPAVDRSTKYAARLDAHLETLPEAERRGFLDRKLTEWLELYEKWAAAVDRGALNIKTGDATAWDYTLTIAEIQKRQARYANTAVPA